MGKFTEGLFEEVPEPTPPLPLATARDLLINLIAGALRDEAGVREAHDRNRPTGYHAGRKAGFVQSAATLAAMLYGTDYEAARGFLTKAVIEAGAERPVQDLRDKDKMVNLADELATKVLEVRS